MTKLIAAFLNSATAPRNPSLLRCYALSNRKYLLHISRDYNAFIKVKEDFLDLIDPEDYNNRM